MRSVAALLPALLAVTGCAEAAAPPPLPDLSYERLDVGGVPVQARVVTTAAARRRGLMGVERLRPDEGLLFVYRDAKPLSIWMRGCLIALDVAFLDEAGTVLQVDTLDAPHAPDERPARTRSPRPCALVLEVPGGFFGRHGLGPGTRVILPRSLDRRRAAP